ncbi:MAG: sigma-70 family RNA polymerase sigma factor [Phycisphaerales bacterium]
MNPSEVDIDTTDLVKRAQFGCQESMERLARQARHSLFVYIYRLTLNHNTAEDLVQDALLEMVKSLKKLNHPECFRAWLFRTALGKVQHYFRDRQHERTVLPMSALDREKLLQRAWDGNCDGLKNLINRELSQAIVDAMAKLKLRHRNILILRCCEHMPYSEIAKVMNCSQFAAQVLFFRAKQILKQKLSKHGFGKTMLAGGLGMFGFMTNPAQVSAVSVSAASVKVNFIAAFIGFFFIKPGLSILTLIAAGMFTAGTMTLLNFDEFDRSKLPSRSEVRSFHYVSQSWSQTGNTNSNLTRGRSLSKGAYEQWYFFPEGVDGPMFMMMQRWDPKQVNKLCGWLQNGSGNYYYHSGEKTIYLYNYHLPLSTLQTRRLPSDSPQFTEFLDQVEGKIAGLDYSRDPETGLLTGVLDTRFYNAQDFKTYFSYNDVDEKSFGSFRYTWPDASIMDVRDEMHKRGWTNFQIAGNINGNKVQGFGQIPFTYDTYLKQKPWLRMQLGDRIEIIDCDRQAYITSDENVIAFYPSGSFFKGLARQWSGMHTIDVIRRDAANQKIKFSIRDFDYDRNSWDKYYGKAEIKLFNSVDPCQPEIIYTIDIDRDLLEKIEFPETNNFLEFNYPDIDQYGQSFTEPTEIKIKNIIQKNNVGILWLKELSNGTLIQ